ncbi:MAG: hypothetical protein Q8J84_08610 [Flavobacteriaceae bacterium]|nr:hypothetical protein [Flavobacteriaceae bacterium]
MKPLTALFLFCSLVIILACDKEDHNELKYVAQVIGQNQDCGEFTIQFISGMDEIKEKIGSSVIENLYIAKNLPDELKTSDILIRLDCRKPTSNELGICTTMGSSLTWVFITAAEKK